MRLGLFRAPAYPEELEHSRQPLELAVAAALKVDPTGLCEGTGE